MSEVKWTKEQRAAIYTRNCNLLVAAAAGSGKTAVLVERIIEMITDKENPIDIDKLLVVTFTNAAASEMRERIGEAISKAIKSSENSKNLQRQLALLNKASITTIHSFCLEVIKNNFHMIDLDPGFRIGDETETSILKNEALDELFDFKYEEIDNGGGEDFKLLIESYCGNKNDENLKDLVRGIYNRIMSLPEPIKWLKEKRELFNIDENYDFGKTSLADILRNKTKNTLIAGREQATTALNIAIGVPELEPCEKLFRTELAMIENSIEALHGNWVELCKSILNINLGTRFPTLKKLEYKESKDKVKSLRDSYKDELNELIEEYAIFANDEYKDDIRAMYRNISSLSELVVEFIAMFKEKKKERAIIDFNDFEHYCLELLVLRKEDGEPVFNEKGEYVPSQVAESLRDKYDEILIDEYQDSNMVQEVILNMISKVRIGEPNVFMVGDVKQSIYRFRQANPQLFLDKYERYSEYEGEQYRKIQLFRNFRSMENIIKGTNFIFEQIMTKEVGELNYTKEEALNFGAEYYEEEKTREEKNINIGGPIEINLINDESEELQKPEEYSDDLDEEDIGKKELEARLVAERIRQLIDNKDNPYMVLDKNSKQYREVKYEDIVILLRSTSGWSDIFVDELKKRDIPVFADAGSGYFENTEVKTIVSLLHIIDNPIQDIHLIAVMRSPIGAFTPEELVQIRKANPEMSIFEASIRYSENRSRDSYEIQEELKEKISMFLSKLKLWREKSLYMPLDEFIWQLYMETGYYGFVGALNGGVQRQANLKILFQRAKAFDKTSYKGVFNFINFLNRVKSSSGDMGSAKVIGENENVVRIMSIHKSKGLEFPIVFLSAMGKQFNLQDLNNSMLFHEELGFGPNYINLENRATYPTLYKDIIKIKLKLETLSEEMRILYVAFTRAREKLILTATLKDVKKYCEKVGKVLVNNQEKLPLNYVGNVRTYLDWIIPCVRRHKDGSSLREFGGVTELGYRDYLEHKFQKQ